MKRLLIQLLLAACTACTVNEPTQYENVTHSEVLQIVQTGQAQGKNYVITKRMDGNFDVQEVKEFPTELQQ